MGDLSSSFIFHYTLYIYMAALAGLWLLPSDEEAFWSSRILADRGESRKTYFLLIFIFSNLHDEFKPK